MTRRLLRTIVIACCAAALAGCQLRVATDVVVESDGSGTIEVRLLADQELRETLDESGFDLRDGLEDAAAGASWEVELLDDDGGMGLALTSDFATPDELGERVDALSAALTPDDGALLRDVELTRTEDGGYAFSAAAGIDPPRVVGALPLDEDAAVRFDGDDLAAALADAGDELARADLRVTFPTVPVAEDGTVDTTSVTWSLPVDGLATVAATAPPLPFATGLVLAVATGVAALLVTAFLVRARRSRR